MKSDLFQKLAETYAVPENYFLNTPVVFYRTNSKGIALLIVVGIVAVLLFGVWMGGTMYGMSQENFAWLGFILFPFGALLLWNLVLVALLSGRIRASLAEQMPEAKEFDWKLFRDAYNHADEKGLSGEALRRYVELELSMPPVSVPKVDR